MPIWISPFKKASNALTIELKITIAISVPLKFDLLDNDMKDHLTKDLPEGLQSSLPMKIVKRICEKGF